MVGGKYFQRKIKEPLSPERDSLEDAHWTFKASMKSNGQFFENATLSTSIRRSRLLKINGPFCKEKHLERAC